MNASQQPASAVQSMPPPSIVRRASPARPPLTSAHFAPAGGNPAAATGAATGAAGATLSGSTTPLLSPPAHNPTPSSILLNKPKPPEGILSSPSSELSIEAAIARVNSPDGTASDVSAGAFSDSNTVTSPSSAVSSPGLKPVANLGAAGSVSPLISDSPSGAAGGASHALTDIQRENGRRSSSPHCHFAPLPKVGDQDRSLARRNSSVQAAGRVKPFVSKDVATPSSDTPDELFQLEMGEQLGSALRNLSLQGRHSPALGRRRASRSSSAPRSTSPSPSRRPGLSHGSSSPAMSRQTSSDAINVHYIEGSKLPGNVSPVSGGPSGSASRDRNESGSRERERERHESERERELQIEMARIKEREAWKEEREAAARATGAASSVSAGAGSTTPLMEQGERTLGLNLNPSKKPIFVEPTAAARVKPIRKNSHEEVVEIEPGQEANANDELEEVEEEDEEVAEDDEEEAPSDENDDNEDYEDDEGDDDDDDDPKDDEDEDEDDDEHETEVRATARGAAVEVVHWHRPESPSREEE
ncbi:BQ2448_2131 [Microbotryum intermedium]|uniref:BQ2448_2131 protein n=1 Tax=Microbotryum intermedium TaxID=269621 RepID=A0A238FAK3_9BASI|nr:BQ2448_2131 [Microbotryum intermedium]